MVLSPSSQLQNLRWNLLLFSLSYTSTTESTFLVFVLLSSYLNGELRYPPRTQPCQINLINQAFKNHLMERSCADELHKFSTTWMNHWIDIDNEDIVECRLHDLFMNHEIIFVPQKKLKIFCCIVFYSDLCILTSWLNTEYKYLKGTVWAAGFTTLHILYNGAGVGPTIHNLRLLLLMRFLQITQ